MAEPTDQPSSPEMTYEQKEKRLEEILERLDRSETPMDELASDAREASQLIKSMRGTLKSAKAEIERVFEDLDEQERDGDRAAE